jgi:hypothetical protein
MTGVDCMAALKALSEMTRLPIMRLLLRDRLLHVKGLLRGVFMRDLMVKGAGEWATDKCFKSLEWLDGDLSMALFQYHRLSVIV